MRKKIAVLAGDGIGPEVTAEAVKILKKIAAKYHHEFIFVEDDIGGTAIEKTGEPLPTTTLKLCRSADAILFGAVGDPKYENPGIKIRPEQGLLALRKKLGLYANVRPIMTFPEITAKSSILRSEILKNKIDFVVVRELTGGIYFGQPRGRKNKGNTAFDTCVYRKKEIQRVAHFAFDFALKRRGKLTLVDKANVLETSKLWRETIQKMAKKYSKVQVEYLYVDNAAMQILRIPDHFDVILTENMFGDILTDEASVISGSLGLLPSASLGKNTSLFEPIHGSYPQAAGKNVANPVATILAAALMLEYSFCLKKEPYSIRRAINKAFQDGFGTIDLSPDRPLSTQAMGNKILEYI